MIPRAASRTRVTGEEIPVAARSGSAFDSSACYCPYLPNSGRGASPPHPILRSRVDAICLNDDRQIFPVFPSKICRGSYISPKRSFGGIEPAALIQLSAFLPLPHSSPLGAGFLSLGFIKFPDAIARKALAACPCFESGLGRSRSQLRFCPRRTLFANTVYQQCSRGLKVKSPG